jgi:methyl-accepting chemotaxis protein
LRLAFLPILIACFALLPGAQSVSPPPDGGYPSGNTAEGTNALFSLTTGVWNTALGYQALNQNTDGYENTAAGVRALFSDTTGGLNTAIGVNALYSNTIGHANTATGFGALFRHTTGNGNTAIGSTALHYNTTGNANTAVGDTTLFGNSSGSNNTALGSGAGNGVATASNVIAIGAHGENVSNTCYIGNIFGVTSAGATAVYVNSLGKLGTVVSSRRFKDEIKAMDKASEAILALKPVTFRYKQEIDPGRSPQFGLVAEDVEKVSPDLVVRDADGKVNTVRYEAVNAMLLNEFLKEHRKNEEQEKTIAELKSGMTALAATVKEQASQIQKVSAHLEASKFATGRIRRGEPAPQVVDNNNQ